MRKSLLLIVLIFVYLLTLQENANAGGPLVVKGGKAITYGKRPLLYRYDKGPLGMFSNAQAIAIFEELYHDWEAISTTEVKFERDNPGSLSFDVDASNFDPILKSEDLLNYTPVVFDNDGTLLDAFLGMGAGNNVLGLSGPITVSSGPLVNQIAESQAIFNGRFVNGIDTPSDPESTVDSFKGTIIHETGHGLGLDHSQINVEAIKPGASQDIRDKVPLMFPVAVNDLFLIRRDDKSAISFLYPNQSNISMFGKIEGTVFRKNGTTPVLGANVIAKNVDDPTLETISCVSDYLKTNTGTYTLFAVPPGKYKIEIEPVDLAFTGASGVGPYSETKSSESFQDPVPKGFYTGSNKPISTDPNEALVVEIAAGQTINDVNIVAAETIVPNSSGSSSISTVNEVEPNDSPDTAQIVHIPVTISGHASKSDDGEIQLSSDTGSKLIVSDLYKFTVTKKTDIVAVLSNDSDLPDNDLDLALFDETANMIIDSSSQTGNVDELITRSLSPGTYILGVGAFSGSTSYKLKITTSEQQVALPSLSLQGSDTLILKPSRVNKIVLQAKATNFASNSKCKVSASNNSLVRVRPTNFSLNQKVTKKRITVSVPVSEALKLISNKSQETVTINIICNNSTKDEFDVVITSSIDNIQSEERVEKANNWHISTEK